VQLSLRTQSTVAVQHHDREPASEAMQCISWLQRNAELGAKLH
jgi:hypothetical protein